MIDNIDAFEHLCRCSGISDSYYDIRGVHHVATFEAKKSLLRAMHMPVGSNEDVYRYLSQIEQRHWQSPTAAVLVYPLSDNPKSIVVTLDSSQLDQEISWQVFEEQGKSHQGSWYFEAGEAFRRNDTGLFQFNAPLPAVSDIGYHRLKLRLPDGSFFETALIVAPHHCYEPACFQNNEKIWGVSLQLYALRSHRNWGIGDFTDLSNAVTILAPMGVDLVGINPLHALFSHLPENASPYSPSSRDFVNPIYLDVEKIAEFAQCTAAQKRVSETGFQQKIQRLRDTKLVDYTAVWSIKLELLELLYDVFRNNRPAAFEQFQENGGEALYRFSLFEALQNHFHRQDPAIRTWQQWPKAFHDPESEVVKDWAREHSASIEFHQYLQWQASRQLSTVDATCRRYHMRIGIYNDLAVGNERFSAQCWAEQSQYALGVGVGAPPDDFNLSGQNWGLPPLLPQSLTDTAYDSFIRTLRANMQCAGALRIDHVMGLMRLYWVPEGYPPDQGSYIHYPLDDLLNILALESQRNRCVIVGEDLGTVADELRHQLWLKKVLSYRVLFFEKNWHEGSFKYPHDYPPYALCTSGSHDMPTFKAYWRESDIKLRETLNLYPSNEINQQQIAYRSEEKNQLLDILKDMNLLDHDFSTEDEFELFLAIQTFLAHSNALIMSVQLEDILGQIEQVNVPGTIDEYPNWRHKISINLEDWLQQSPIAGFAEKISRTRGNL